MALPSLNLYKGLGNLFKSTKDKVDFKYISNMFGDIDLAYIDSLKYIINLDKLRILDDQRQHRKSMFIKTREHQIENENPIFRRLVSRMPGEYDVESHVVQSEDGYLLKVFRVTPSRKVRMGD